MKLIYDLTFENLHEILLKEGYKRYRSEQVWDWLYLKKVKSFQKMTNLPPELIEFLEKNYIFDNIKLVLKSESEDGTIKFLFELYDGNLIESVLMNHHYGRSVCVTSQVGCNIGCSFCASGKLSKKRDLTTGEMVLQVLKIEEEIKKRVDSVVIMGIGEPFDNFDNVMGFISIINDQKGINIGARKITVSTSGLVPEIYKFADLKTQVNLAISLHSPDDKVRSKLMRINKVYQIDDIMQAMDYYLETTSRRVTIEYILIDKINDTPKCAHQLASLLKGKNVYVNLIPYNEVLEAPYKRSKRENQMKFYDILKKNNIDVTLRKEQGHDINAACGQLRSIQEQKR